MIIIIMIIIIGWICKTPNVETTPKRFTILVQEYHTILLEHQNRGKPPLGN